jgi:hypothetical protein
MLFFNHVTCYLNRDNKKTDIEYNINYIYKKLFTLNKKKNEIDKSIIIQNKKKLTQKYLLFFF